MERTVKKLYLQILVFVLLFTMGVLPVFAANSELAIRGVAYGNNFAAGSVPVPERFESVYKAEYTVHTSGEPCNTDEVESSLVSYKIDDWALARGWGGSVTEYNDYVEIKRSRVPAGGQKTSFSYHMQPSTQAVSGLGVTNFALTKVGTGEAEVQLDGGKSTLANLYWREDNTFLIRHRTTSGAEEVSYTKAYADTANIHVLTDDFAGTFSLWINGDCVLFGAEAKGGVGDAIRTVGIALAGTNFITVRVSEFDTYRAYPFEHIRASYDAMLLTEDVIRGGIPAPAEGKLAESLNLVTAGKYGSTITWRSSDEALIATDGTLNRPENALTESEVVLTATVAYRNYSTVKTFTFNVLPLYTQDDIITEKDEAYLTTGNWNFFSFSDTSSGSITTSLNLPDYGPYGSSYIWRSSKPDVITSSGRVTRPRWDLPAETVTMTASIVYGASTRTKAFTFTVQPDEYMVDPNHMSDEDFFGVWNGSAWTTVSKLDYAYSSDLSKVEEAAKKGDYQKAKEELLTYMKNRPQSFLSKGFSRKPEYAEAFVVTGIHNSENHNHFAVLATVDSHDYKTYKIPVGDSIIISAKNAYKIGARYNEDSTIIVASKENANEALRPHLEMTVNGEKRSFVASGDAVIRGGSNAYSNFSKDAEMAVRYFGEFQGEDVSDLLVMFDLSSLKATDRVSDINLCISAKISEPYATEKELVIYKEGSEWDESTVTMKNIIEYAHNFNGIPGGNHWRSIGNAESEYVLQTVRMTNQGYAAAEYAQTGDEKYAYAAIRNIMDFIIDTQGRFVYSEELNAGRVPSSMDWEKLPDVERYGAYPRALDMGLKLDTFISIFDLLADSRYMSPDVCTAILKNMWHGANELEIFLTDPVNANTGANQRIIEANCYSKTAAFLPEFSASSDLVSSGIEVMEHLMRMSFFPDGAYIEATDGYAGLALTEFITFWDMILKAGYDYSDSAKTLLSKGAMYIATMRSNGGVSKAWGDNGKSSTSTAPGGQDYYALTGDEVINFINTYGRAGTEPEFTSVLYESMMTAFMRSDWTDKGLYMLVPSSGTAIHGHSDSNSIILNAFQRAMLIDGGYFNYDTSPERAYMKSTLGHNTVEIDNTDQRMVSGSSTEDLVCQSTKNAWVSNDEYDHYSVTTHSNQSQKVDHRRSITFLKPYVVIVSDLMTPEEANVPHTYKQLWHMSNLAKLDSDAEERTIFSNFNSGANIKIASADTDAVIYEADGWDTESWGVASVARYGYYQKENVAGNQTFDTVLMPYENQGDVSAEHIALGVPSHDATAMKITTEVDGEVNYIYYMLDYDHVTGAEHNLGKYLTDAELMVVRESEDGEILEVIMNNGSFIKKADGTTVLVADSRASSLSYELNGADALVLADDAVQSTEIEFLVEANIQRVLYNKVAVEFINNSGVITLTGLLAPEEPEEVPEPPQDGTVTEAATIVEYSDSFTSAAMNERIVLTKNALYDRQNGVIKSTAAGASVSIYLNRDKSPVTGKIGIEYTLRTAGGPTAWNGDQLQTFIRSSEGDMIDLRWYRSIPETDDPAYRDVGTGLYSPSFWGTEEMVIKVIYDTNEQKTYAWVDGKQFLDGTAPRYVGDNVTHVKFETSGSVPMEIKDFKWYTLPGDAVPAIGEVLYHESFDSAEPTGQVTLNYKEKSTNPVKYAQSYEWKNGKLKITGSGGSSEELLTAEFPFSSTGLTGEYVIEYVVDSVSVTGNGYRMYFDGNMYVDIGSSFQIRNFKHTGGGEWEVQGVKLADYNADKSAKVTAHFNSAQKKVSIYLNDILVKTFSFKDEASASVKKLKVYSYPGTITLQDVRVYRPLSGVSATVENGIVKLASDTTRDLQLYLATYTGSGDAKSLARSMPIAFSAKKGMTYSIPVLTWNGAKLFVLNSKDKLQPLCESMDVVAE